MKTDQYLNLCLDQAAQSTLHYRHGCVVVKGGKVIGQGFNDCRPGYDGNSVLKTGVLPKAAASAKPDKPGPPRHSSHFKTVESIVGNCGGGHHANARLTMHSEMMAINSALSSRSTLAANTVSHVKPCFRLLGDSKRKRALRRNAVLSYAQAACLATLRPEVQQGAGPAEADESRAMKKHGYRYRGHHHHHHGHHSYQYQNKKKECKNKHNKHRYKAPERPMNVPAAGSTAQNGDESDPESEDARQEEMSQEATGSKRNFGLRRARNQHLLVPKGRTVGASPGVKERTKHPKLVGADVYVARLANDGPGPESRKKCRAHKQPSDGTVLTAGPDTRTTSSAVSVSTGSLHDELITKTSKSRPLTSDLKDVRCLPTAAGSRPCYRCVAYMHSVGIKRVFWTDNAGKWEGAKVRDLIDHLDGIMHSDTGTTLGQPAMGLFVTKHEVLMLRRLMGNEG